MKPIFTCLLFLTLTTLSSQTLLEWPLKLANNCGDANYYYLSNYVDHDGGSGILDYNGGGRTYNGHDGTDIVLWPFWWKKMAEEQVDVVAAADGVIVSIDDGHFDQSCAWTGGSANHVRIRHYSAKYLKTSHTSCDSRYIVGDYDDLKRRSDLRQSLGLRP